jgi:hypothetical protein
MTSHNTAPWGASHSASQGASQSVAGGTLANEI